MSCLVLLLKVICLQQFEDQFGEAHVPEGHSVFSQSLGAYKGMFDFDIPHRLMYHIVETGGK